MDRSQELLGVSERGRIARRLEWVLLAAGRAGLPYTKPEDAAEFADRVLRLADERFATAPGKGATLSAE